MSSHRATAQADAPSQPNSAAPEHCRYFHDKFARLVSYRKDGSVYVREAMSDWRCVLEPAPSEAIRQKRLARAEFAIASVPVWAQTITDLPSAAEIEAWVTDSVVEATDGEEVEPDGHSGFGAPSWLLALRLV